jgi:peroxiredoxin
MKTLLAFLVLLAPVVTGPAVAYEIGDPVADIQLTDLDDQPVALSDHHGEIVLLNFFATWCPGCNEEAAVLEQDVWQAYQDDGVTVIAINIQEPAGLVSGWAAALGLTYPIWLAPDWSVLDPFTGTPALPYNAVIGREMTLQYAQAGFDRDEIVAVIEQLLADDTVPTQRTSLSRVRALFAD